MVRYDTHEQKEGDWEPRDMPVIKMRCKPNLTLAQVSQTLIKKLKLSEDTTFAFCD